MHPLIPYFEPLTIPIPGTPGLHGFGILVGTGVIVGAATAARKLRRDGLDPKPIGDVVVWIVAGMLLGGHLGHVLFYEPAMLQKPAEIFKLWHGLSSFGGFVGVSLACHLFYSRLVKARRVENEARQAAGQARLPPFPVWSYWDAMLYAFALAWFFGRMGCFATHDHPGSQTHFWLGVVGMCPTQGPRDLTVACHDVGLYEGLLSLVMFGVFVVLDRKPRFPGFFLSTFFMTYAPIRLFLDIFRHPASDARYLGLTPAQYGSVLMFAIGAYIYQRQRGVPPIRAATA